MEEGWVQCDDCQGWVHQICGLFNKGNNKENADFHCPACLEEGLQTGRRDQVGLQNPNAFPATAPRAQSKSAHSIDTRTVVHRSMSLSSLRDIQCYLQ